MADQGYSEGAKANFDTAGTAYREVHGIIFPASGGPVTVGGVLETGSSSVGALAVGGGTPHDSVDSGNPLKLGGKVVGTPSAVADADRVNAQFDQMGKLGVFIGNRQSNAYAYVNAGPADSDNNTLTTLYTTARLSAANATSGFDNVRTVPAMAGISSTVGLLATGVGPGFTRVTSGSLTGSGQSVTLDTRGAGMLTVNISGTFVATVVFEYTIDGVNYSAFNMGRSDGGQESGTSTSGNKYFQNTLGIRGFRVRCSAYTSGTIAVEVEASPATTGFLVGSSGGIVAISGGAPSDTNTLAGGLQVHAAPSVYNGTNWDRTRAIAALSTVTVNTRETGVIAAGVGPGWTRRNASDTITSNGDAVTFDASGVNSLMIDISGTWVATLIFEYSTDGGTTWNTSQDVMTVSSSLDAWIGVNGTTTTNGRYRHFWTNGVTNFRVRASAYTSGTATVLINGESTTAGAAAIKVGPAPHEYGYTETGVSATYTSAQTSTTLGPTVSSTQRMVVTYIQIQSYGTTAGTCVVYFGTGAYSRGTNKPIFDGEFAPSATLKPGFTASKQNGWIGAADEELKVTTTNAQSVTVTVWYYLVTV